MEVDRSWRIRRQFIKAILARGDALVPALTLAPDVRGSISEKWQDVVREEFERAMKENGASLDNPLFNSNDIRAVANITNPALWW